MLMVLSFGMSVYLYDSLPEKIPMHWNVAGEIDRYESKITAVWFMPILISIMWVAFKIFPQLDPNKEKYRDFQPEWEILQTLLLGFFVYLQIITFYIAMNPASDMMKLMFSGMGVLFMVIGNFLPKIRQNFFIGIKIPWTLTNEENWNKTHRFGGWCFVVSGLLFLIEGMWRPVSPEIMFGTLMALVLAPMVYSYSLFLRRK